MPLKDNRVADPEVKRMRCWKCDGSLETDVDGMAVSGHDR